MKYKLDQIPLTLSCVNLARGCHQFSIGLNQIKQYFNNLFLEIYILFKELSKIIISINIIELQQNYQFAIGNQTFLNQRVAATNGNIFHFHDVYMVKNKLLNCWCQNKLLNCWCHQTVQFLVYSASCDGCSNSLSVHYQVLLVDLHIV